MLSSRRPRNHSCWNQAGSSAIDSLRSTGQFIEMHRFVRYFWNCFVGKVKRSVSFWVWRNIETNTMCPMFCHAQLRFMHGITHDPLSYTVVFCDLLKKIHMSFVISTQVDRRRKHTTQRPLQLWLCTVCQRRGRVKRCEKVKLWLLNVAISPLKIYNGFSTIFDEFRQFVQDEKKSTVCCMFFWLRLIGVSDGTKAVQLQRTLRRDGERSWSLDKGGVGTMHHRSICAGVYMSYMQM